MITTPGGLKKLQASDPIPAAFYDADSAFAILVDETERIETDKANKSTLVSKTLLASGWNGTPKKQTLSVAGITASTAWEVLPALNITNAQLEALQGANLQDGGQSSGSITLLVFGDVPEIDIPVRVIVRGDM